MPWNQMSPMDQKTQFIADNLRNTLSITEVCELYGISHKTGYKWVRRYTADGIWSIYFYDVLLARLDERNFKLYA